MVFERKYSNEVRDQSVERVLERRRGEPRNRSIVREVAEEFGIGQQSLRQWVARFDDGSYDYDTPSTRTPAGAGHVLRGRQLSTKELLAKIAELEQRVAMLDEDNRSLTRVVSMFADQLRLGGTMTSSGSNAP